MPQLIVAAIIHDWIYVSHQIPREKADKLFRDLSIIYSINKFKAKAMYRSLRMGGSIAWKYSKKDKEKLRELYPLIVNNSNFKSYCFPENILQ